jgi:hypothetical protein
MEWREIERECFICEPALHHLALLSQLLEDEPDWPRQRLSSEAID